MSNDKYIHSDVEDRIYSYWEKNGLFKPKKNTKQYSIVIPPPIGGGITIEYCFVFFLGLNKPFFSQ